MFSSARAIQIMRVVSLLEVDQINRGCSLGIDMFAGWRAGFPMI